MTFWCLLNCARSKDPSAPMQLWVPRMWICFHIWTTVSPLFLCTNLCQTAVVTLHEQALWICAIRKWRIGLEHGFSVNCSRSFTELLGNQSCAALVFCLGSLSCWKIKQILPWRVLDHLRTAAGIQAGILFISTEWTSRESSSQLDVLLCGTRFYVRLVLSIMD